MSSRNKFANSRRFNRNSRHASPAEDLTDPTSVTAEALPSALRIERHCSSEAFCKHFRYM